MKRVAKHIQHVHKTTQTVYRRAMPAKKSHRAIVWAIFLSISCIVSVQILYPLDRAVPLARLDGKMVGFQKETELIG